MKSAIQICVLLIGCSFGAQAQTDPFNLIEVYWGKETKEAFDYEFVIVSANDTIRPVISNQYYFPVLELDSLVTVIVSSRGKQIVVPKIDSYYLSGYSFLKFRFNPVAADTCIYLIAAAGCTIDVPVYTSQCQNYHEVSINRYHRTVTNSFSDFYEVWKYEQEQRAGSRKLIETGTPAMFEIERNPR
jgi:hypothetical protein